MNTRTKTILATIPKNNTGRRVVGLDALVPLPSLVLGQGPESCSEEVELGYVSGVFGIRGELRIFLHHPDSVTLETEREVVLTAPDGRRFSALMRARSGAGKRILGVVRGLTDPDAAAHLKDWTFSIPAAELPEPDEGEFYVFDLEGLEVFVGERRAGSVTAVHETVGGDILEIDVGAKDPSFVPVVERFVLDIDLEGGRIQLAGDALEEP